MYMMLIGRICGLLFSSKVRTVLKELAIRANILDKIMSKN